MIKHILLAGAATLGLAALSVPAVSAPQKSASKAVPAQSKKPQLGTWGFDVAGMDRSVKPGDSFFDYANGNWARTTEIPPDRSSWGGFGILVDLSDQRTKAIIEEAARSNGAPGSNARKVGDFYASFMDQAAIEAKGTAPLKPFMDKIAAIRTTTDLARAFGEFGQYGVGAPIGGQVEQDLKDNSRYTVYVGQGGLGLPDRDYYLDDSNPKFVEARAKYKAHIATMLRLAGIADADARAQRIYDLEHKIAEAHWTRVQQRQFDKLYNPMSHAEMSANMPGFDWHEYLTAAGLAGQQQIIVAHPSALQGAAKLIQSEPIETWKDYLTFRTIAAAAPLLPNAFVEESFNFNGKALAGTPQLKDRWKRGTDLIGGTMGEAVGQLYVAKYFPPEAKAKADELVQNLIRAMDARLANLTWMTPETKVKARAKLAAFTPKIGYPDKWRDYSALEIRPGDALGNALRAGQFEYRRNLAKLGKPIDRSEWGMSPQTVNAYANPLLNEVVFPAAILQPPFFDPNADDAVNYGGIGAVIGHEISHHFDDQGRKFDPQGNLSDWWTEADIAQFKKFTDQLGAQYSAYEPLPGSHVNGDLTMGENIADLAGLTIAYDAYKMSLGGKPAPVIDGFTGDQRFFLGYGQVWRTKYRDQLLQQLLTVDSHSPGHFRPLVVRNFDPWYQAFAVRDGKYYLPPEQRVRIW
ncbi:MAG TPA: M13-type metalloendopeptidase [Allosphingosinicella sp.]|nr:M13-type metalloendopeptidase [Allosphingosinicella sp.]